jgi:Uncharacterized alpha/beta hydrolase domain (DUF2235)
MKVVAAILGVVATIAAVILLLLNSTTQDGLALGALFGILSTPARAAGVDFRQWFRDPSVPLPSSDDTAYGLTRFGVQAALGASVVVLVLGWLIASLPPWLPSECRTPDDWGFVQFPPTWYPSGIVERWPPFAWFKAWGVDGFFLDCHGVLAFLKLAFGIAIGVVLAHAFAEWAWRRGLRHLPQPRRVTDFLAPQSPPYLRARPDPVAGRRRLIVCCDGTWNWPESRRETNVIRLVRSIEPIHNGVSQIVYYHQGVGTGNILDRLVGGGAGVGLSQSVRACYGFLCDNYQRGDEIFLFGFSRGAYIARCVAGVVGSVGILDKAEMVRFFEVWDWYSQPREERNPADLAALAPRRHRDVEIEVVGVWDTVGALGIPGSRFCAKAFAFYETGLGPRVRHAFQALAIDERRGNFQAAVWVPIHPDEYDGYPGLVHRTGAAQDQQVLEQVWLPGAHANIGGGYEQHGLSDTAFLWMLNKVAPDDRPPLLGVDLARVRHALDPTEPYPVGKLQNPRTIFWRLIGSPVPRPVGIITPQERVHDSAWQRDAVRDTLLKSDVYREPRRHDWITAMSAARVARRALESRLAVTRAGPAPPPLRMMSSNIGVCGRLLQFFGGSG